jgi:triphosphoribosyl-dephospho-CoA synthase/holo-ACP synthase/triphosphoribosyl-dephospho-CoA synthase
MDNLLDAREKRDAYEAALTNEYGSPLITLRANYPGPMKSNLWSNYAVYRMFLNLRETFGTDILEVRHTLTCEGLVFFLVVSGKGEEIKRRCITLEGGRQLGRLLDIDVREKGRTWSRADLDYGLRRCFICSDDAVYCVRSMRHDFEEVANFFRQTVEGELIEAGLKESLSRLTAFALLNELCREYSYGCVTVNGTGSHKDMDFMTFIESIGAISENIGQLLETDVKDFQALRAFGCRLEEEMFRRTGGINTHKGAIFILVFLLAGFVRSSRFSEIQALVSEGARPVLKDFESRDHSHGLEIYRTYGIRGIRESAANGFPNIFGTYLPLLENQMDPESLFLTIMSREDDTNVIHRSGPGALKELKARAAALTGDREKEPPQDVEDTYQKNCQSLSDWCIGQNISTGGSADILSASILVWMLKKNYHHLKGEI